MGKFASQTTVPWEKTRSEIEQTLARYKADRFAYAWEGGRAVIMFEMNKRRIRFTIRMPEPGEFKKIPGQYRIRTDVECREKCEQSRRQLWRALLLVIKAKLEAVESGIAEFEDEFLAHIILPDGRTAGQWMKPQIAHAYETRTMPPLLLGAGIKRE